MKSRIVAVFVSFHALAMFALDYTVWETSLDLGKVSLPATIRGTLTGVSDKDTMVLEPSYSGSYWINVYPYTGPNTSYNLEITEEGSYFGTTISSSGFAKSYSFVGGKKYTIELTSFWCPEPSEYLIDISYTSSSKSVRVKFDGNGGQTSDSYKYYDVGDRYSALPSAERSGYSFDGWYTARTGGLKIDKNSTVCMGYETLYAHWVDESAPVFYKIVMFYPNGGNGDPYSQILIYGYTLPLQANKFMRDGYEFVGWSGTPDGEVLFENEEAVYLNEFSIDEIGAQIPLYAKWKKLPNPAVAATETVNGITWTYRVSNGGAEIYNLDSAAIPTSTTGAITIPSMLGGYPVTSIGGYAFFSCFGLTHVTIPDSVINIGDYAFFGCLGLTSMMIPDGVKSIGDAVFAACFGLTNVTIGNGVTSIGYQAFSSCSRLESFVVATGNMAYKVVSGVLLSKDGKTLVTVPGALSSVTIPDNVTNIRAFAFAGCSKLTGVAIPESVTSLGGYAFYNCTNLTSMTIPDSMTSIGYEAFSGCNDFLFDTTTIPDVKLVDGWAVGNTGALSGDLNLTDIRGIGDGAFAECSGLTSVTISDGVMNIGVKAFYNCTNLTYVTIPRSVTNIDTNAFLATALATVYVAKNDMDRVKALLNSSGYNVHGVTFEEDGGRYGDNPDPVKPDPVTPSYEVIEPGDITEVFVAPKAVTLQGAAYDGNDLAGLVELKLGKVNAKKGTGKVSGTVTTLDGKKYAIKAYNLIGLDGMAPVVVSLTVKNLGRMDVTIGGALFAGSLGGWHVQSETMGGNWSKNTASVSVLLTESDLSKFPGDVIESLLPSEEKASVKKGKWTFEKAANVKWAKPKKGAAQPEIYDESSGKGLIVDNTKGKTNLSGLKLTYTPKNGTFKGSFKVYALQGEGKATKLKKYTVNVNGFVVGGVGYGTATCKKPAVNWSVTVR